MPSQNMHFKLTEWVKWTFSKKNHEKDFSAAILRFSARFVKELEKDKSIVASPLSAEFVLALLTLGTSDSAHSELLTALGLSSDDAVRSLFSHLTTNLKALRGVTLHAANKVYVQRGLDLEPRLRDQGDAFATEFEDINFGEGVADVHISKWAERNTNSKIKDILPYNTLDDNTQAVFINAVYFKGAWKDPFKSERTRDAAFYVDANTTISMPIMSNSTRCYKYGRNNIGELLVLPYEGEQVSLVIILPNEIDGVNAILDQLADGYDLMAVVDSLQLQRVHVSIPRFKIETEVNLNEVLPKLGIKSVFNPGIKSTNKKRPPLCVSLAVQKVAIEVVEEGTESTTSKVRRMPVKKPPHFIANRPFVYIICGPARVTLFLGVYRGDGSEPSHRLSKWAPPTLRWEQLISSHAP